MNPSRVDDLFCPPKNKRRTCRGTGSCETMFLREPARRSDASRTFTAARTESAHKTRNRNPESGCPFFAGGGGGGHSELCVSSAVWRLPFLSQALFACSSGHFGGWSCWGGYEFSCISLRAPSPGLLRFTGKPKGIRWKRLCGCPAF